MQKTLIKINFLKLEISYNIAVCYYQLKQYDQALRNIAEIIEKGIKEHPGIKIT